MVGAGRGQVLLVGGVEAELASAQGALRDAGFTVEARREAFGISAWILREQPEVVLLDPDLPLLGGRDLVPLLRNDANTRHVNLLLWVEGTAADVELLTRTIQADGYIRRGIGTAALVAEVKQWSERSRSARQATALAAARRTREVLFVHGDPEMLRRYQEMFGATLACRFIESGRAAFRQLFDVCAPAVVVTEIALPDLSGETLYRTAVRRDERWAERFVFLSAGQQPATPALRALSHWSVPVLIEPCDPVQLRRAIDVAIRAAAAASDHEVALVRDGHGGPSR